MILGLTSRILLMAAITTLFLVRHGQTQWNCENRVQGQLNSPLTNLGKIQATQVRKILGSKNIHSAYSSPLLRAVHTTSLIIKKWPVKIQLRHNLSEIHQGPWQGRTYQSIQQTHPEELHNFWENPSQYCLSGAESFIDFQHRVITEINSIFQKNMGKNILVVSHGIVIKVINAYILHQSLENIANISLLDNGECICLKQQNNTLVIS